MRQHMQELTTCASGAAITRPAETQAPITNGRHYHTIKADTPATLDRIERALDAKGYLVRQP